MAVLPPFTSHGTLPPGDYELTLAALGTSTLVVGPGPDYPSWDVPWRRRLVDNLEVLVEQLWKVGIREVFIDGSFVEDKDQFDNELEFPSAFRLSRRDGRPRGIVKIGGAP